VIIPKEVYWAGMCDGASAIKGGARKRCGAEGICESSFGLRTRVPWQAST
jgi:hypothetical protein